MSTDLFAFIGFLCIFTYFFAQIFALGLEKAPSMMYNNHKGGWKYGICNARPRN